jgi:hypothetical protein
MGAARDRESIEHSVKREVRMRFDPFCPNKTVYEFPVELLFRVDARDVGEAKQVRESILVEMNQKVHERDLRVDDSNAAAVRKTKWNDPIPYHAALTGPKDLELQKVNVEIEMDALHEKVDRLEGSAAHKSLDRVAQRVVGHQLTHNLADPIDVVGRQQQVNVEARAFAGAVVPAGLGGNPLSAGDADAYPFKPARHPD